MLYPDTFFAPINSYVVNFIKILDQFFYPLACISPDAFKNAITNIHYAHSIVLLGGREILKLDTHTILTSFFFHLLLVPIGNPWWINILYTSALRQYIISMLWSHRSDYEHFSHGTLTLFLGNIGFPRKLCRGRDARKINKIFTHLTFRLV